MRTSRRAPRAVAAAILVLGATGCGLFGSDGDSGWQQQAAAIDGIVDYRESRPEMIEPSHTEDPVAYEVLPPVGGAHYPAWLNCQGAVYGEPVANERAVHSMEHGAVWITYRPDLPADQREALAARVRDKDKLLMSPYPDLGAPISLQAWGYQLQVEDATDARIDEFIAALRVNASLEGATAPCTT